MNVDFSYVDPKLARGLVREELRHLRKMGDQQIHDQLADRIADMAPKYLHPSHKISNNTANKIRDDLYQKAKVLFNPIREYRTKVPLMAESTTLRETRSLLYWWPTTQQVLRNPAIDKIGYSSDFVTLRVHRYGADRRRFILDDFFCNVLLGDHVLVRMIERTAVDRRPLQALSDSIEYIVQMTSIYNILHLARRGHHYPVALIPFKEGILIGRIGIAQGNIEGTLEENLRYRIQTSGTDGRVIRPPFPAFFAAPEMGEDDMQVLQITTFIAYDQLSSAQHWAVHQLNNLMKTESARLPHYFNLIVSPESCDTETPAHIRYITNKMHEICKDPRWDLATASGDRNVG